MGLIDKFKKTENTELLHAELKAKVITKEEIPAPTKKVDEKEKILPKEKIIADHQNDDSDRKENPVDDLEKFIEDYLDEYSKSEKSSRMIRIQEEHFDVLAKLKVHNISISKFVNFAIHSTLKSEQYKKIIKIIKNKQ